MPIWSIPINPVLPPITSLEGAGWYFPQIEPCLKEEHGLLLGHMAAAMLQAAQNSRHKEAGRPLDGGVGKAEEVAL
jgi:hypothetical protein